MRKQCVPCSFFPCPHKSLGTRLHSHKHTWLPLPHSEEPWMKLHSHRCTWPPLPHSEEKLHSHRCTWPPLLNTHTSTTQPGVWERPRLHTRSPLPHSKEPGNEAACTCLTPTHTHARAKHAHTHTYTHTGQALPSLAASPSTPGWSLGRVVRQHAGGGEGLANFALDHVFLECQLPDTCEPVECQFKLRTSSVSRQAFSMMGLARVYPSRRSHWVDLIHVWPVYNY